MKLHIVPAIKGLEWIKLGIQTFFKQPLAIAGLFFMFMALVSVLSLIPYIGNILALILLPAFTIGIIQAAYEASNDRFPMPKVLITAFLKNTASTQTVLILGALYTLAFFITMGVTAWIDGGTFAQLYLFGGELSPELVENESVQKAALLATVLYIPLAGLFWFSPGLVYWNEVPPAKALFFSAWACIKNAKAMLLFLLGWLVLFIVVAMVLTLLSTLLGPSAMIFVFLPTVLLMAAMFSVSIYFTYQDCFHQ